MTILDSIELDLSLYCETSRIGNSLLVHGDCLESLRSMPDNSIDSIVTDPPYGLSFMGKRWDYDVPPVEVWVECLRVLKPGGHLLAFAGTRTQHRMAVRIEDAGFEIRDMIAWVYGSGFPKSHNLDCEWSGWGTALKPALEPITVARKPLVGTVAANVLEHGTGALNIDGCRVGEEVVEKGRAGRSECESNSLGKKLMGSEDQQWQAGRWPANLIHDGSDEVRAAFPQAPGQQGDLKETGRPRPSSGRFGDMAPPVAHAARIETDKSAARFFYCAKASKRDRDEGLEGFAKMRAGIGDERPSGSSWERRAPEKKPEPATRQHPPHRQAHRPDGLPVPPGDAARWCGAGPVHGFGQHRQGRSAGGFRFSGYRTRSRIRKDRCRPCSGGCPSRCLIWAKNLRHRPLAAVDSTAFFR